MKGVRADRKTEMPLTSKIGNAEFTVLNAGSFWSDAGAAMGILPWAIWKKSLVTDDKNRIQAAINLLLIKSEGKNILVDTGLGNRLTETDYKHFNPETASLPELIRAAGTDPEAMDFVILTHLHFDHAGGIVTHRNGKDYLAFPNAVHVINRKEWEIAVKPDLLNNAAYDYESNLKLLDTRGNVLLVDQNFAITSEVMVEHVGGHTNGMQVVWIRSNGAKGCYPADILSREANLKIPLCFAYDVCRKETAAAKIAILNELKEANGWLFLNHDMDNAYIKF
ncbi:MAG: MBL fold metallo-hydrolase [Candidatus Cloacimonetes bacterium]|nr:MBL fold metallo-hydrolase [Candidatus Cloacimonadota bacterium]